MSSPSSKREFTKARHAQRRDLAKACREVVKATAWRSNQGVLFAQRDGWFVAVHEITYVNREETRARLLVKPMTIDPIFWDLVGEPQLYSQSLSFRYFGALTCPSLILGEPEVSEDGGTTAIAQRMLDLAKAKLEEVAAGWTADDFLDGIKTATKPGNGYFFATAVATLIALGRDDEALAHCDEAIGKGDPGGFVGRNGSLPEKAAAWIRAKQRSIN